MRILYKYKSLKMNNKKGGANVLYPVIEVERIKQNYTRKEIADYLDVTTKTYASWLNKGKIPSCKLLELSKLFNVSIDYLLSNTVNRKRGA